MFNPEDHSHRRLNILTGEWIQVSPHRSKRPWQGQVEKNEGDQRPEYDEKCYLCPTNTRVNGENNPDYKGTYVFSNDFGALVEDIPNGEENENNLLVSKSEKGLCRVICFSPQHNLTLPLMSVEAIRKVVDVWTEQYIELSQKEFINYVQIFENKGAVMGCSNPHPHGQIWAQETVPVEPAKKSKHFKAHFDKTGKSILSDYLQLELEKKERIIIENEFFVALVPYWATWPYETMIVPKRHVRNLAELTDDEKTAYAEIIKLLTIKYDNLFETSFPYSSGIHQSPTDGNEHPEWHLHMSFYPPLLRSASVKKFMVGYEMFANPQRDITAEFSAKKLRELSDVHYSL